MDDASRFTCKLTFLNISVFGFVICLVFVFCDLGFRRGSGARHQKGLTALSATQPRRATNTRRVV